jgi:hypothetical protein
VVLADDLGRRIADDCEKIDRNITVPSRNLFPTIVAMTARVSANRCLGIFPSFPWIDPPHRTFVP